MYFSKDRIFYSVIQAFTSSSNMVSSGVQENVYLHTKCISNNVSYKIKTKKSGVIYRYKCGRVDCDEEYIGEYSKTFGERFREHLKVPSPIFDHFNISGHNTTLVNFSIVGREDQNLLRFIKESI